MQAKNKTGLLVETNFLNKKGVAGSNGWQRNLFTHLHHQVLQKESELIKTHVNNSSNVHHSSTFLCAAAVFQNLVNLKNNTKNLSIF